MSRENDVYPVSCARCGKAGTLEFWREDDRWGVVWNGFRGTEALISMPKRARGTCLGCSGRKISVGERISASGRDRNRAAEAAAKGDAALQAQGKTGPNEAQDFGSGDILVCTRCNGDMRVTRRTPHPALGADHERQTFTCVKCGYETMRDADSRGDARRESSHTSLASCSTYTQSRRLTASSRVSGRKSNFGNH